MSRLLYLLAFLQFVVTASASAQTPLIRVNGLGYPLYGRKLALVTSNTPLADSSFAIFNAEGVVVFEGALSIDRGAYLAAEHHYLAEFTSVRSTGRHFLRVGDAFSPAIVIEENPWASLPDSLLHFFHVQRCGDTDPELHNPCHLYDVPRVLLADSSAAVDATGGWHDAGDYTKFTMTSAEAAWFLLLAWQYAPGHSRDTDGNGLPDVLDEAKVGLDWLIKMHPASDRFLIQVQDHRDHGVGWRMPSEDPLAAARPGFGNLSKTQTGMYAAAMALAADVFGKAGQREYGRLCLAKAKSAWNLAMSDIPDHSTGPDSMYYDRTAIDNLALAAVELWRTTKDDQYRAAADSLTGLLQPRAWVSWGDLDNFALARYAPFNDQALLKTGQSLARLEVQASQNPLGYPLETFPWGSATVQMGVAAVAIMHAEAVGEPVFLPLALRQCDFILGMNGHGVSFIVGAGENYPRRIHHQVSYLTGQPLNGALVGGFVARPILDGLNIPFETRDRFARFQTKQAVYIDDRHDYVSNEPTVAGNALAYLVFSWLSANGAEVSKTGSN